eukprot:gene12329-16536_t
MTEKGVEYKILCNICRSDVDGIAYRTICHHFFCPICAKSSFQHSVFCPICRESLSNGDVVEITVGLQLSQNITTADTIYQCAYQNTSWTAVMDNIQIIAMGLQEVMKFSNVQLQVELMSTQSEKNIMKNQIEQKIDILKLAEKEFNEKEVEFIQQSKSLEEQLSTKNKEIVELQEAYKEKSRKCQAWEKAYNSVRNQIQEANKQTSGTSMVKSHDQVLMDLKNFNTGYETSNPNDINIRGLSYQKSSTSTNMQRQPDITHNRSYENYNKAKQLQIKPNGLESFQENRQTFAYQQHGLDSSHNLPNNERFATSNRKQIVKHSYVDTNPTNQLPKSSNVMPTKQNIPITSQFPTGNSLNQRFIIENEQNYVPIPNNHFLSNTHTTNVRVENIPNATVPLKQKIEYKKSFFDRF